MISQGGVVLSAKCDLGVSEMKCHGRCKILRPLCQKQLFIHTVFTAELVDGLSVNIFKTDPHTLAHQVLTANLSHIYGMIAVHMVVIRCNSRCELCTDAWAAIDGHLVREWHAYEQKRVQVLVVDFTGVADVHRCRPDEPHLDTGFQLVPRFEVQCFIYPNHLFHAEVVRATTVRMTIVKTEVGHAHLDTVNEFHGIRGFTRHGGNRHVQCQSHQYRAQKCFYLLLLLGCTVLD